MARKEYIYTISKEKREAICQMINTEVIMREGYLKQKFSAGMLCEKHGVTRQELSAVMRLHFGENFSMLIMRQRVNKACQMLTNEAYADKSCEAIGLRCGFSSRQSMHNAFIKIKGITALEYRIKHTKNNE